MGYSAILSSKYLFSLFFLLFGASTVVVVYGAEGLSDNISVCFFFSNSATEKTATLLPESKALKAEEEFIAFYCLCFSENHGEDLFIEDACNSDVLNLFYNQFPAEVIESGHLLELDVSLYASEKTFKYIANITLEDNGITIFANMQPISDDYVHYVWGYIKTVPDFLATYLHIPCAATHIYKAASKLATVLSDVGVYSLPYLVACKHKNNKMTLSLQRALHIGMFAAKQMSNSIFLALYSIDGYSHWNHFFYGSSGDAWKPEPIEKVFLSLFKLLYDCTCSNTYINGHTFMLVSDIYTYLYNSFWEETSLQSPAR